MKKILSFALCIILGLTLVSCSSSNDQKTESNNSEEISDTANDSTTNDTTKQEDKNSNTSNQMKNQNENTNAKLDEKKSNLVDLTTYTIDEDTLTAKNLSTIQVEDSLPLNDKLTKLADELSVKAFNGLPIKVVKVETVNGTKKATINLENLGDDNAKNWSKTYFQGTTGGTITTKSLIETFKQSSYKGEWINSVQFLYNNEKIQYEHVSDLTDVINLR